MRATRLLLVPLLLVAGCGDDGDEDGGDATPSSAPNADAIVVDHAFGETELAAPPERVVTVGLTEQDAVLALGVVPVGVTDWYGDQPDATWPWAQDELDELGDATPEVLDASDGLQFERIAALDPDLIIGTNAGLTEETYEQLSAIAPTVAHAAGDEGYFSPWDRQTLAIGRALGLEAEAQALVDDIDAQFAAAAEAHPEFAGSEVIFLQNAIYDGEAIAYQKGLSTDFLTDLGFAIPDELDPFVREADGSQAFIPLEQLSVLDAADVLLWATESPDDRAALEEQPLYLALEEVTAGRQVFTDGLTAGAIYFTSVLSLPFVLEQLVPALASTLAGDGPATIDAT